MLIIILNRKLLLTILMRQTPIFVLICKEYLAYCVLEFKHIKKSNHDLVKQYVKTLKNENYTFIKYTVKF